VETTNKAKKEKSTVNVLWTQSGEEQPKNAKLRLFEPCLLAAPVRGDNRGSNLTPINGWAGRPPLEPNYQLESRMREICQSGSEGGAKLTFVPTPISAQAKAWAKFPRPFGPKPAPNPTYTQGGGSAEPWVGVFYAICPVGARFNAQVLNRIVIELG
jgi:hypothetical protein